MRQESQLILKKLKNGIDKEHKADYNTHQKDKYRLQSSLDGDGNERKLCISGNNEKSR